jgi:hypothetical protein
MAQRNLSIERLYFLGDFKNIKIGTTLEGLPEDAPVRLLLQDLMLSCDIAYQDYKDYNEAIKEARGSDVMDALKKEKDVTITEEKETE